MFISWRQKLVQYVFILEWNICVIMKYMSDILKLNFAKKFQIWFYILVNFFFSLTTLSHIVEKGLWHHCNLPHRFQVLRFFVTSFFRMKTSAFNRKKYAIKQGEDFYLKNVVKKRKRWQLSYLFLFLLSSHEIYN